MELDPALVGILPERPGHPRERGEDRAVDGGEPLERLGLSAGRQRHGLGRQFPDDRPPPFGVEDASGFGERPEGGAFDAELLTGLLPAGRLLQGAEALPGGVAEIHRQERDVLVVEELVVAGVVAFGADVMQSRDQFEQGLNQPLPRKKGRRRIGPVVAFRSPIGHSDNSKGLSELAQISCRTLLVNAGMGGVSESPRWDGPA